MLEKDFFLDILKIYFADFVSHFDNTLVVRLRHKIMVISKLHKYQILNKCFPFVLLAV